jgi:transaldolase
MNPLLQLKEYGQSCWLDNLTRDLILAGELARRVRDKGLTGVTSNPAIFHKAIGGSKAYQEQITALATAGRKPVEIYEELVIDDIRRACDIFRPVYDSTAAVDGYVSLEVSPYLARDTAASLAEARRLWRAVDKPNLLIKIPGTAEGVGAVEQCLYEGINVNITLLFSIEAYQAVALAYVSALERRAAEGQPVDRVASVASFFLSRIDTLVDQQLQKKIDAGQNLQAGRLLGKVAVANAKLAYQQFKQNTRTSNWQALAQRGARVQRLLWASTSTKNPNYYDLMYVEPRVGPDTVNTMPDETIAAVEDHGKIRGNTVEENIDEAAKVMSDLQGLGIDFEAVTNQLLEEGIRKFVEPFDALLKSLGR